MGWLHAVISSELWILNALPRRYQYLCPNRIQNEIQGFAQTPPVGGGGVMPIEQRVLRKANDDVRHLCGGSRRSLQIELAILNALFQNVSQ